MSCDYCWPGNCCGGPNCMREPKNASDILERLRTAPGWWTSKQIDAQRLEAADEIERLQAMIRPFENAIEKVEEQGREIERLRAVLNELADLMDDAAAGSYKPDSFTTQPARRALEEK